MAYTRPRARWLARASLFISAALMASVLFGGLTAPARADAVDEVAGRGAGRES